MTRSRIDRIVAAIWWILVLVVPGCYSFLIPKQQNIQRSETSLFGIPSHSRQVWREKADPSMHRDFMSSRVPGGYPVSVARDNTLQHYVYFARLNSKFCFVFNGMTQVLACRAYLFCPKASPFDKETTMEERVFLASHGTLVLPSTQRNHFRETKTNHQAFRRFN